MTSPLDWIAPALGELEQNQLRRWPGCVRPLPHARCEVDGRILRNFSGNDYLDLAHDPRVIEAATTALAEAGVGVTASPVVTGRTPWHHALEEQLAAWTRTEAAILFPTGYAANLGTIAALAGAEDIVFCERLNHACLVDGCRLTGARLRVFRQTDLARLDKELARARHVRRKLIVTDSLFSMDGHCAPLPELCDIADRHGAMLIVDEAHGFGVVGAKGEGVAAWQGTADRIPVRIGTLSKAFGSLGGFVCGSQNLIDWLWNRGRTQVFSTALPPALCAAASQALEIIQSEPWRRTRINERRTQLTEGLRNLGYDCPDLIGTIVPVVLGSEESTLNTAKHLRNRGFLVGAIRPPTVPRGTARLRITLSSAQTSDDVSDLLHAISETLGNARLKS